MNKKQTKDKTMSNEMLKKLDVSQIDYKQKDVIVHRFISKYPEFSKSLENLDQSQRIAFFDAFIESQHKFVDFMNTPSWSGRTWKNKDEVK
tara:strand:+ start:30 stop:302 length:273 start_codon:yes stop_codon:yes gene_type:complete